MYMISRAVQFFLAGRMRPVGRRLESPGLQLMQASKVNNLGGGGTQFFLEFIINTKNIHVVEGYHFSF